MGEVKEHRYVCKICSKSCVSGKSLGGHMRVHSALIPASKRLGMKKSQDDQESFKNQSNSDEEQEEEEEEFGDGDQSSSYGLRENPRKSWRVSDPKHSRVSKNTASCKECGKDFPSLRALSGHMRSHSAKNNKAHKCKTCGKGFDSMRAMFGHMKTHSVRSKPRDHDNAESLSDLDDLCPIRRKRTRIGYKAAAASSPSLSGLNASTSAVSELEDVEEAAKCLMMLSRGDTGWAKFDFAAELSDDDDDDDSAYFGANSSCKSKNNSANHDKIDDCVSDCVNKNSSEEMEVDSDCKDEASIAFVAFNSFKKGSFLKNSVIKKRKRNHDRVFDSMETSTAQISDSKLNCSDNILEHARMCSSKIKEHECPICFKVFPSGQALGGHKRAHYNGSNESKSQESLAEKREVAEDRNLLDLNYPVATTVDEDAKSEAGLNLWWPDRTREHEPLVLPQPHSILVQEGIHKLPFCEMPM